MTSSTKSRSRSSRSSSAGKSSGSSSSTAQRDVEGGEGAGNRVQTVASRPKKETPKPHTQVGTQPGAPPVPVRGGVSPIKVDARTRRSDEDALEGLFATIVHGEHKGRFGVFDHVQQVGLDGYPETVLFVTRDDNQESLVVPYKDIRHTARANRFA